MQDVRRPPARHASPAPILFRLERGVGHGARGVGAAVELFADVMVFRAENIADEPSGLTRR
ncbi:hypothetical protein [Catenulispora sp. GAS73]|uniref:hypothetical protein n=1 Tax=Catenulispora sp. GAS73 TaxID=3156269 RepID=UPI003519D790